MKERILFLENIACFYDKKLALLNIETFPTCDEK